MRFRRGTSALRRAYRHALDDGDHAAAERLARQIVEQDSSDGAMWFDLGLAAKRRRDWPAAIEHNERALAAAAEPTEEPAAWNLGIAATAVGDWARARRAWSAFGITMPPGDGPLEMRLGHVPVRLNPGETELGEDPLTLDGVVHDPEVVWAERLSPAHARIANVPTPDSGHRWGDLVLHDGVPDGERFDGHRWVSVFNELALLERSPHPTWTVEVTAPSDEDRAALVELVEGIDRAAEDWTTSVRPLCPECSRGRPGKHDHDDGADAGPVRLFGLAGSRDELTDVLIAWAATGAGRSWDTLGPAVGRDRTGPDAGR
ncbi:conserved hypothetical protein [Cellulomonas flavigena DSM 20109]|uniref:Tetratricopeptide TPR_2 repeat protein n=1 Tax=Cellulomonas flavigena (strain ATCC 482 / DSM 20109 / BCRC 11376 / JCM 18109 / NBRC 3775 / NCIMB 8073 / NRS 134) TaxID=446466 RepID=D5UGY4_CELFN|nr:tetratricopeptide repeat protein [Cellulomonas flavigena]ADG73187.1 conserved hypothetical protein [Cellulomonas flavigena DSM 20109]